MPFKLTRCVFLVCVLVLCSMSTALAVKLEKLPIHQKEDRDYNWHTVKMGEAGYFLSERGLFSLGINAEGSATVRLIHSAGTHIYPGGEFTDINGGLIRAGSRLFYLGHYDYCDSFNDDVFWKFELWKSDGTSSGTTLVKEFNCNYPNPDSEAIVGYLSAVGNSVFFQVRHANGEHVYKEQLWKADGLTNAVYMVKEFDSFGSIYPVVGSGDVAFFVFKGELWKTDGSPGNTTHIALPGEVEKRLALWRGNARDKSIFMHEGKLYFGLLNKNKRELWVTDGSQAGTRLVKVIKPNTQDDSYRERIRFLTSVGNVLYFNANDGVHGTELWKTDGTPNGTTMLRDIKPDTAFDSNYWPHLAAPEMDNSFFFVPPTGGWLSYKMGIWKTNGTPAGTNFIKDPALQVHRGYIDFGAVYDKEVYFYFSEYFDSPQKNRKELWKTDGTAAGTAMVKDFYGKPINSDSFFVLGDSLFFWAWGEDGSGYYDLWRLTKSEATGALPATFHLLLHDDE